MKYRQERGDMIETYKLYIYIHMDFTVSTTVSWKEMLRQQQEGTNIIRKSLAVSQVCISMSSPSELLTAGTHDLLMSSRLFPCRLPKTGLIPSGGTDLRV